MVAINEQHANEITAIAGEQCTTIARIYRDGRGCPDDMRQMRKRGWKVVSVREQQWPVSFDRIRAESPGALTRLSTSELVVFYQRCGQPSENRVKRMVTRFRGTPKLQA